MERASECDSIVVLVISLPSDETRRATLKSHFGAAYDTFRIVWGIDLRATFQDSTLIRQIQCPHNRRNPLSAGETGCALSHLKALREFLSSDRPFGLILEDDVIGDSIDISEIKKITANLPADTLMICGGQEGLKNHRHLFGSLYGQQDCWHIPQASRVFMSRACCYVVTPASAKWIIQKQESCLDRADNWSRLLAGYPSVFFTNRLKHPIDLSSSHLEPERSKITGTRTLRRILVDGLTHTAKTNLKKVIFPIIAPVFGYRRIIKSRPKR